MVAYAAVRNDLSAFQPALAQIGELLLAVRCMGRGCQCEPENNQ
jgi:hypothetical protein